MSPADPSHVAYADESRYNVGRFRSVAAVSLPRTEEGPVTAEFTDLLQSSDVEELSWKKLTSAKYRFAAIKLLEPALRLAAAGRLRADVLMWDTHDTRHAVPGRDDIENLARMYHHLFVVLMRERWPDDAVWLLRPDEQSALDWEQVRTFLQMKEITPGKARRLGVGALIFSGYTRRYRVEDIGPVDSAEQVLVQLADLLAGLVIFSRETYDLYASWEPFAQGQHSLFEPDAEPPKTSASERERFRLLQEFNQLCKGKKLGVSLQTYRGLRTLDPRRPVNFWWYEPQGDYDTAPVRIRT